VKFVVIDFETASACDLKKAGAWVYSEHPTTEIICLGYAPVDDVPYVISGDDLSYGDTDPELQAMVEDPERIFVCHNCAFEKSIWRNIMVPLLGWPDIPDERWLDTMASCAMKGLPLALERVSQVLRLATQKDTDGTKITLAFSRTDKKGYYDRSPDKISRSMRYCGQDCKGQLELYNRVRGLGPSERRVWLLDQQINQRGVRLDTHYITQAQKICDDAAKPLKIEFDKITDGITPTQDAKFKAWLIKNGCPFPTDENGEPTINLQKETINKLLGERDEDEEDSLADDYEAGQDQGLAYEVPHSCRRALRIRKVLGSRSISKLKSMQACCGSDGRARWLLQYHGAGPGRWAGRLLQPQNFLRPTLKISTGFNDKGEETFAGHDVEQLVAAILTGDHEHVRMMFGEPIEAVANGLRHALIPDAGNVFEVGDFMQVEARIVMALAGQHDKTAMMAAGQSPYIPMAEAIFKRKIDKHVDIKEYTIGKHTILGCGFQMGAKKFRSRYCPNESPEFAQRAIDVYRKEECPLVPKVWYAFGEAATKAVWDRVPQEAYGIRYALEDGWLTARLPSGRKLWYYDPKAVRKAMPWSTEEKPDIRPGFTYGAWKAGQWKRVTAYGGLLTENVVQAMARDLLVNALFNSEAAGHPVVLTVHDEDVNEVPDWMASANLLEQMMCDIPPWARAMQIPIGAECWVGERYRK
jgi:DNA polymerase